MKAVRCQVLSRVAQFCRVWLLSRPLAGHRHGLTLLPAILLSGCAGFTSTTLPPATSAPQPPIVHASEPLTVGVVPFEEREHSDSLIKTLKQTGLFAQVVYMDELSSAPDLVARVEEKSNPQLACPVVTLLTLGLVPTRITDTYGHVFSLQSPGSDDRKVLIDHRYKATTTVGWVALCKALSKDETLLYPERHARYRANLRHAIIKRSPEIEALIHAQASVALH